MKLSFHRICYLLGFLIQCASMNAQPGSYISLNQHTEILENKRKVTNDVDLFYDKNKQTIIKYYYSSPEFVMVINSLGEIKTYYPASNEVEYKHVPELSSKRNLIYFFANNLTDHLGLADEGFVLNSNTYEDQFYITIWKAPSFLHTIETVKMVFENGLPIYSEYQTNKQKILKKIYYTNYKDFIQFMLPQKIIEISYMPSGDSIINRTLFSNVKVSSSADNKYFNFKIPDNAKPLGVNENK